MSNEKNYFEVGGSVDIKGAILRALANGQGPKNKSLIMPIEEECAIGMAEKSLRTIHPDDVRKTMREMIAENEMLETRPRSNERVDSGELLFWIDRITPKGWEYLKATGVAV